MHLSVLGVMAKDSWSKVSVGDVGVVVLKC